MTSDLNEKRRLWVRFQPDPCSAPPFDVAYEVERGSHIDLQNGVLSVYDFDANVQSAFTGVLGAWFSDFIEEAERKLHAG